MYDILLLIGYVYLGLALFQFLYIIVMYAASLLCGLVPRKCEIGIGYPILRIKAAETEISISPLLIGSSVEYRKFKGTPTEPADGTSAIDHSPWYVQVILNLIGFVSMVAIASIWLGQEAISETIKTWGQVFQMLTDYSKPFDLLVHITELFDERGLMVLLAIIFTKVAGWNLIPIPPLGGGNALLALVGAFNGKGIPTRAKVVILNIGLLLMLTTAIVFLVRVIL